MKEIIKKYWWGIMIVLLIGGAFYWYEFRPFLINKHCSKAVMKSLGGIEISNADIRLRLDICLMKYGLEK